MLRRKALISLIMGLVTLAMPTVSGAEKPKRAEIAKRGKAATAFVEVPGGGTGTAFCVDPTGLFVTNEHVVRGAGTGEVILVLDPALATERVLKARVVREDKGKDLALLRVDGVKGLPSLPLGSVEGVSELADVVACGFPLGKGLAADRREYPAISVNAGSISALRHVKGELHRVQIDIPVTFGNSGGPVLDDTGAVVGVVVAGHDAGRTRINLAIPVSHLSAFLAAPDVSLVVPDLTTATAGSPHAFRVKLVSVGAKLVDPRVRLVLRVGDEKPREFPLAEADGVWTATAVPVPSAATRTLELSARFGSASIAGSVADRVLTANGKPFKLGQLRKYESMPKPSVTISDGAVLEGPVVGLAAVEMTLGTQRVTLDLASATHVAVQPADVPFSVSAAVVVSVGGKDVARVEREVAIRDAAVRAGDTPTAVTPPALTQDKVVKSLPEAFTEVATGGNGRYLVFRFPKLKKLGVFDLTESKVVGYVPLAEDKAVYAAGLNAVIVGLPEAGRLERWSLATLEREKSVPRQSEMKGVVMGHGTDRVVAVDGVFLDPVTFRPLPVTYPEGGVYKNGRAWIAEEHPLFASADGSVYGHWNPNQSPSDCGVRVLEGGEVKRQHSADLSHTIPGPDGKWVYTAKGVVSRELKYASPDDERLGYCLPAAAGDYFLSLTTAERAGTGGTFTVFHRAVKGPVARLPQADHGLAFDSWDRERLGPWKRVVFVPDAKAIVVLPEGNDRVVLHRFDPDAALAKCDADYLFVTSRPPGAIRAGAGFRYPVQVRSKTGGVRFHLSGEPKGMAVSPAGEVTWAVPADAAGEYRVILSVTDKSGQEAFHPVTVTVVK